MTDSNISLNDCAALAIANVRRARHGFPPMGILEFRTHKEDFLAISQEAKAAITAIEANGYRFAKVSKFSRPEYRATEES